MDKLRMTGRPWRSWTAIAFVLLTLAVIQACDSGRNTGPTTNSALQLKLHRVGGAEIPAGCTGVYSVSGPGVNIQNAALPASGQISFQGQVGQTYTVTVTLSCGGQTLTGSAQITLQPGGNTATIELTVSKVTGVACSPNPVQPGQDSTCTCNVQSPGAPSITWTGATPTSGNQARFNNTTPGTYGVTCSVNGVANGSTSVTVGGDGAIQIFNDTNLQLLKPKGTQQSLQRRSFALLLGHFFVHVKDVSSAVELSPGTSIKVPVAPGSYVVEASCNASFDGGASKPAQVSAGQTVGVHFDAFEDQNIDCED
jgi:hypothetical protein